MSKIKETVEEFRNKLLNRKEQEVVQEEQKQLESTLEYAAYDVVQDPATNSRSFLIVKIKYDITTKQATVVEVRPFHDKAAGLSMVMDKENRKYLFERNRSEK